MNTSAILNRFRERRDWLNQVIAAFEGSAEGLQTGTELTNTRRPPARRTGMAKRNGFPFSPRARRPAR
jgi:hypothetical protein